MAKKERTKQQKKELIFFASTMTIGSTMIVVLLAFMVSLGSPIDIFFSGTNASVIEKVAEKHHATDVEISSDKGHPRGSTMVKMTKDGKRLVCHSELPATKVYEADSLVCIVAEDPQ